MGPTRAAPRPFPRTIAGRDGPPDWNGSGEGDMCVFPFQYHKKWYNKCTRDKTGKAWCATSYQLAMPTADNKEVLSWGYCVNKTWIKYENKRCGGGEMPQVKPFTGSIDECIDETE